FLTRRSPPRSPLFPYTTLFRSKKGYSGNSASSTSYVVGIALNQFPDTALWYEKKHSPNSHPHRTPQRQLPKPPTRSNGFWNCMRSEEHTSELQSRSDLVCRLLL